MAKLNVKVIDMVNGEVTKIAYEGAEYAKVDGAAVKGDIGLVIDGWGDQYVGEYYKIVSQYENHGKVYVSVPHKSGTFDAVGYREDFVIYRKSPAQSSPTIEQRVDKLEREVAELKDTTDGVVINGVKYRRVDRKGNVGDFVKFTDEGEKPSDTTVGKLYEITEIDHFGDYEFKDDDGDKRAPSYDAFPNEVYEKVGVVTPSVVEEQLLQVGDYAKVVRNADNLNIGDIVEVRKEDAYVYDFRCYRLIDGQNELFDRSDLTRATDEEVAEAKRQLAEKAEIEKWAKIGREVGEFKVGDIIAYKYTMPYTQYFSISQITNDKIYFTNNDGRESHLHKTSLNFKLAMPVESRFDLTEGDE